MLADSAWPPLGRSCGDGRCKTDQAKHMVALRSGPGAFLCPVHCTLLAKERWRQAKVKEWGNTVRMFRGITYTVGIVAAGKRRIGPSKQNPYTALDLSNLENQSACIFTCISLNNDCTSPIVLIIKIQIHYRIFGNYFTISKYLKYYGYEDKQKLL